MGVEQFVGVWRVDNEQSDSIEPMLKAMGVGWKIRKVVTLLKVLQKIEVNGDEFVVKNVSKHGEDCTIHVMNGGERVIRTNRGDEVIDNCTWNESQEFPLKIVAVLPQGKGSTIDMRKVESDGNTFIQHLIYKHPSGSGSEKQDILMKRVFVRVKEEKQTPINGEGSKQAKKAELHHRHTSSTTSPAASEPASPPKPKDLKSVHAGLPQAVTVVAPQDSLDDDGKGSDHHEPNSPDMWVVVVFSLMGFTLLFAGVKMGGLHLTDALPALLVTGSLFLGARILARTSKGERLLFDQNIRWGAVVVTMMGATFTQFKIVSNASMTDDTLRIMFVVCASAAYIVARVHAGLMVEGADSPFAFLRDLDDKKQWGLTAALMLIASGCYLSFGLQHPGTVWALVTLFLSRFAIWYNANGLYERMKVDVHAGTGPGGRKMRDREGKTLKVSVIGYRIVDDLYAQYKVQVSHEGKTWIVWRRFSQFDTLRHELRRMFGPGVLPKLPAKTWFSSLDEDFLEERVSELNAFVSELMDDSLRKQVFKIAETRKFLGVGQGRGSATGGAAAAAAGGAGGTETAKATPEENAEFAEMLRKANETFDKAASIGEGDGWKFLKKYQDVQCYMKTEGDFTYSKGVGTVDFSPLVVSAFMADLTKRKMYDELFKKDTLLRQTDLKQISEALGGAPVDVCDVKHVEFKSPFPMAVGARDCLLITCRMIYPDGTVKVIMVSPDDRYCPPNKKYIRAKVFAAGLELRPHPQDKNKSIITNIQMMDPNGSIPGWIVKAIVPERCAMCRKVEEAMKKLPKLPEPLPIPHSHKD